MSLVELVIEEKGHEEPRSFIVIAVLAAAVVVKNNFHAISVS